MPNVDELSYRGWSHCLRLRNDAVEAVITADVGPRIIRFGFIGGPNEFAEYSDQIGNSGGRHYRSYGGHRLWAAPEDPAMTYYPDNDPVEWRVAGETLHLIAPIETTTGIRKELELTIDPSINTMQVRHRITNCGTADLTLSAWALSVMAPGGRALLPQEPFRPHPEKLLPVRPLVLWSYTDMSDPRWYWGTRVIQLRQDPSRKTPQKIGVRNTQGWVGYRNADRFFVKTVAHDAGAAYPDFGSNVELFTNANMLELETLSPLVLLSPGSSIVHDEHWFLFRLPDAGHPESPDQELLELERFLKDQR